MEITLDVMNRPPDKEGRLYYRIRGPHPETGKRTTLKVGRWTEREAADELKRLRARETLGLELLDDFKRPSTVSELGKAYTTEMGERLGAEHRYVVEETERLARVILHLGAHPIDTLTRQHLESYAARRRQDPCRTKLPVARKSIAEEIHTLRRAFTVLRGMKRITCDPPPFPSLKAIPDDARPQRRLTEAEIARLIRAAELEDVRTSPPPREGTTSRAIWDLVHDRPGLSTAELVAATRPRALEIGLKLVERRRLRLLDGRWFPLAEADAEVHLGLATLITVLAWSGRRPVAVFHATRADCERLIEPGLAREERLMFWSRDKGGIGRGYGPVTDPAFASLVTRAREVKDPEALLWRTPTGKPWTPERLSRTFARVAARAKVTDVEPYDLRRFAITTILAELGGRIPEAQKYTGHRSARALLRYLFAVEGEAEAAAQRIGWKKPRLEEVGGNER